MNNKAKSASFKKASMIGVSGVLVASLLASCTTATQPSSSATPASSSASTLTQPVGTYPIKSDVTLTYWSPLATQVSRVVNNLGDTPFAKDLEKKTGVKVKFTHPAQNTENQALNIMLATGDLPDMIEFNWFAFPGGPLKPINDGYLMKLNSTIEKNAPNLTKYLKANPAVDKSVKADDGSYYVFPFIRKDEYNLIWHGPMVRKDWLDDVKLPVPTTIDEWTTMLTAFKEQKGATAALSYVTAPPKDGGPMLSLGDEFIGAYGISRNFYIGADGKVQYGPAQPQFRDYVAKMTEWYKAGLLDQNLASLDVNAVSASVASGKTGALIGNAGGTMGVYMTQVPPKDPKFNLVGAPFPVLKKGDKPQFGHRDWNYSYAGSVAITAKSKNADLAARFLDYGYSDEGAKFYNFGVEGVTHTMVNGKPTYTDLIMKNPDKLSIADAMGQYFRANYNGPFLQAEGYAQQYFNFQQQRDAVGIWANTDAIKTKFPPATPTAEESTEYSAIISQVDNLVNETFFKTITGAQQLSDMDKYYATLKNLNVERAVKIKQAAVDRYNARK